MAALVNPVFFKRLASLLPRSAPDTVSRIFSDPGICRQETTLKVQQLLKRSSKDCTGIKHRTAEQSQMFYSTDNRSSTCGLPEECLLYKIVWHEQKQKVDPSSVIPGMSGLT